MKTILKELYEGNIYPDEVIVSKDSEYQALNEKISDMLEIWKKKLSEDDFNQLEDLLDLRSELSSMEASESFIYGFRLSALIMIEVFAGRELLVHSED